MRRIPAVMGAAALAVSVFAAGCGGTSTTATRPTLRRTAETTATTPNPPPTGTTLATDSVITLDEFKDIEEGMTPGEVAATVGSLGEIDPSMAGDRTEARRWNGRSGGDGFAMVVFRDGVVWGKTQVGLS